jgi:N-acetylglucosamine-6-sulfatase
MTGARSLAPFAAAAAALFLAGPASGQPNVVLIVTDDQRWDTLWAMPTVQAELVAKGVTFSNAFVVNPLCCPSRASILTGNFSHTTRVYRNGGIVNFDERRTIAVALRRAGWRTGFLGKYLNGYAGTRVPPGWNRWFAFSPSNIHRFFDYRVNADGQLRDYGSAEADYATDVLAAEAEAFIAADDPRPFLLAILPFAAHWPALPAPRHAGTFGGLEPWRPESYSEDVSDKPAWIRRVEFDAAFTDELRKRQYQSLLAVDDAVGRVVAALEGAGKLEETMIVFTSDNGVLWGEHGILQKVVPYEESIRVPLVVRYGSQVRTDGRLVLNIDLAPTIAELAGVRFEADGASLLPLLASPAGGGRGEFLVESRGYPGFASPPYCALRTRGRMHAVYADGSRELYDLGSDPLQLENLGRNPAWDAQENALHTRLARLCNPPPRGLSRLLLCTHRGGSDPDRLRGSRLYDVLCGRGGADVIVPRSGSDWVLAGAGNDVVHARDGRRDTVDCGPGRDLLLADARDVTVHGSCEILRRAS